MATGGVARLVSGRWSKWIVLALWVVVLAVAGSTAGPVPGRDQAAIQVIAPVKVDSGGWHKIVDSTDAIKRTTGPGGGGWPPPAA